MASDVMSLFGLDPNVIQQQRVQGGIDQASRMSADYAIGAAGGGMLGAGINSAFGLQTPDMQQAQSVQDGMQGQDLTTAAGMRRAASQLMMNGDYAQAMALHAKASEMESTELAASNTAADREFGILTDVNVDTGKVGMDQQPIYRKRKVRIVQNDDGTSSAYDAVTGEDLSSAVDVKDVDKVDGPNNQKVLDNALDDSTTTAESILNTTEPESIAIQSENQAIQQADLDLSNAVEAYELMMPQEQQSPEGVALAKQIQQMQTTIAESQPTREALAARQIRLDQALAIKKIDNQMTALMESYKAMPKIVQDSKRGKELKRLALELRDERAALIESQKTK